MASEATAIPSLNVMTRVMQNTAVLLAGQVAGVGLSFVSSIFLVRALGSDNYGQYALIYAFLSLFSWLGSFGTDNIIVREAARNTENADVVWSNGIFTQVIFSNLAFLGVLAIATLMGYPRGTITFLILASVEMVFLIPWRFASRVFQVVLQQWRSVLASLTRQIVWIILLIILTSRSVSLKEILLARIFTALLEVGLLWVLVRPFFKLRFHVDISLLIGLIRQSWPLAINALSVAVYNRVDQVMIQRYLHSKDLGYYATAVNLAGMMSIIPSAFMASIYPLLCKKDDQKTNFARMATISFRWLLIVSVGLAGLFTILGKFLTVLIYGKEFLFSGQILAILVWSEVAVCYGVVISQILISKNLQNYLTISTFIGAIVNIMGNILILPYFGVIGASWVTVFSYALAGIFLFAIFPATRNYSKLGSTVFFKIMLVGVISLAISSFMGKFIESILFIGLYMLGIIIMRLITKDDFFLLTRAVFRSKIQ